MSVQGQGIHGACAGLKRQFPSRYDHCTVLAKPWQESSKSFKFQLCTPVDGLSYDEFSIRLNAGYGINGMFVHNHQAIEEITRMWERGASTQELLHAFNFQTGLSVKVNGTKN